MLSFPRPHLAKLTTINSSARRSGNKMGGVYTASIQRERSHRLRIFVMARLEQYAPRLSATGGLCPRRERIAKQLILANLGESLSITELAQACALSRSHFSRAFKCSTGVSPQEWIRRQRILRAKELITGSSLSLTQISLECGFCDQAHFCHMFTRSEGVNPMTWRNHHSRPKPEVIAA
ncbi:AraC-type DNA-binding protein [Pseudomonas orientalis]|uniref:AraC-type DNA-binding protein n=2 Tax=Pseudomonas orientalis TaxID=76758 RepID=A0A8B3XRV4_9PSED|nr:AraC-type DNA-binding protein [Pseudomonas orientalis]